MAPYGERETTAMGGPQGTTTPLHHSLSPVQSGDQVKPTLPRKRGRHPRPRPMATALVQVHALRVVGSGDQVIR